MARSQAEPSLFGDELAAEEQRTPLPTDFWGIIFETRGWPANKEEELKFATVQGKMDRAIKMMKRTSSLLLYAG